MTNFKFNAPAAILITLGLGLGACGTPSDGYDNSINEATPQGPIEAQARINHLYDRNGADLNWGEADPSSRAKSLASDYDFCDLTVDLYTPGTDTLVHTLTDTGIPYGLTPIRYPGVEFQGDFEASVTLDCGDGYPFVTEDLLISTSGTPVFPDAQRPSVNFTFGVVSELELSLWQQDSLIGPVEAGWQWNIEVELTDEHAALVEDMVDRSAKGTLSGCTSSGVPVSATMAYDSDAQSLLWLDEDTEGEFLTVGPECQFSLEVKDEGAVRMAGSTSFVATANAGNGIGQDIGVIDIELSDAQLDVTFNYEGVVISWLLDIASVAPYIDSGAWDGDVTYTLGTVIDGEPLSVELERDGTQLYGDLYPIEAGEHIFTLRIADESSTLLEGSDTIDIGGDDEPNFTLTYMLNLTAETRNLTNVYFRAILSDDGDTSEGISVHVEGYDFEDYLRVEEDCITGAGNEDGDEVDDGNATCMVRVPFGHYCYITYRADGYQTALSEVYVDSLDAIRTDYVVLQPN